MQKEANYMASEEKKEDKRVKEKRGERKRGGEGGKW